MECDESLYGSNENTYVKHMLLLSLSVFCIFSVFFDLDLSSKMSGFPEERKDTCPWILNLFSEWALTT